MNILIYFLRKYKFILITFLIIVLVYIFFNSFKNESNEVIDFVDKEIEISDNVSGNIKINIKGAIKNPGVYEIGSDARVEDAIKLAGGLTEDADTSIINLSRKLTDENVIIVYTKSEVKKIKNGNVVIQYIENECNCPEYENSACIDPDILINDKEENTTSNKKISINKATIEELQTLPGIGESKAKLIIEYRKNNGNFKSIDEIKNVKGIGDAVFNKIKDDITI
ncbi:MAG: hypothetical protein E7165_00530 [Firmicutes bacterium]|nr:hypothetical protein [Bacillota bacterium]